MEHGVWSGEAAAPWCSRYNPHEEEVLGILRSTLPLEVRESMDLIGVAILFEHLGKFAEDQGKEMHFASVARLLGALVSNGGCLDDEARLDVAAKQVSVDKEVARDVLAALETAEDKADMIAKTNLPLLSEP